MPNVPHDIPTPHTLVLDLENTLVNSSWDRKYGWRHAKRPGVDKFLLDMAQYYEIVLYSPSIDAVADPVVTSLDKSGCIMHRLYRDATYYKDGVHMKDLNRLNRSINRMVVLDDDPLESGMNPENLIRIKPYLDPNDRDDNALERITPFLIEIAREGYDNIPELLSQYQGMDADEIADEQGRRIQYYRQAREDRTSRGLGGIAKLASRSLEIEPELEPHKSNFRPTQQLTSKDLVGAAPPSSGSDAGLMGFLNRRQEEKEEHMKRKFEKWNEVMLKKQKKQEQSKANGQ
jgi:import inner membrane translocase subunit TIM50